jgi:hypothetical protein
MKNYIIKRELRGSGYRWEMRGNKFVVMDTRNHIEIVLTKVGAMSLVKFLPNYFDKMRIEDNKSLRSSIRKIHEKAKIKRLELKNKKSVLKINKLQKQLFGKAIIKNEN